jgi:predicted phosphodiesterase
VREHVGLDMPTVPKKVHAAATPAARPVSSIRESKKGPRLYVVLSDVHIPYHDEDALEAVCGLMKDLSPHGLVLNGDFLDLLELSRHSAGSVAKLEGRRVSTTFSEARRILNMLQEAAGAGCIDNHFIDGNHEDRVGRWLSAGDNGVFADDLSVDITSRLDLKDRGFKHHAGYPDAGVSLGKLWVTHGRFTNKYHAAKMLDYYRHSVMYGHTHVPQTHCASALHGQQVAYGTGYLADERSEAMSYAPKPNAWVKGFALVYVWPDESFNAQVLNFWRGQFAYGGKVYGRRLSK